MFVTLLVACLAALATARTAPPGKPSYDLNDAPNIYKEFVQKHTKVYDADEYNVRFEMFKESLQMVNELNEKYDYTTFDIYHFADLTKEEMRNYKGFKYSPRNASAPALQLRDVNPPAALDWREKGVVTPVKNQGPCGSCYIFGAIANIESQYAIKHKQCISLSEQQCLDCLDNDGCHGGDGHEVMQALARDAAGCMKDSDYQYQGRANYVCKEDVHKKVVTVLKGEEVNVPDEDYLLKLLASYGPLSVGLDSSDLAHYTGGILSPNLCVHLDIDHEVSLVGYGEENGRKFWIIKNSWGTEWGEKGYVRLERGVNACGMGTKYTAKAEVA